MVKFAFKSREEDSKLDFVSYLTVRDQGVDDELQMTYTYWKWSRSDIKESENLFNALNPLGQNWKTSEAQFYFNGPFEYLVSVLAIENWPSLKNMP